GDEPAQIPTVETAAVVRRDTTITAPSVPVTTPSVPVTTPSVPVRNLVEMSGRLTGHTEGIGALVIAPDGRRAVAASDDWTLRVWDLARRTEIRTLLDHGAAVTSAAWKGGRLVSGSRDLTLKAWSGESGECTA